MRQIAYPLGLAAALSVFAGPAHACRFPRNMQWIVQTSRPIAGPDALVLRLSFDGLESDKGRIHGVVREIVQGQYAKQHIWVETMRAACVDPFLKAAEGYVVGYLRRDRDGAEYLEPVTVGEPLSPLE